MDDSGTEERRINPLEKATFSSRLTFWYLLSLFKQGYQKELEEEDIYKVLKSCQSNQNGDAAEKQWHRTRSLVKTLIFQFGKWYLILCLIAIIWSEISNIFSPLGLSKVVAYFTPNQKKITRNEVYGYASILVALELGHIFVINNVRAGQIIIGVRTQAALKSLLYRKALRMSQIASGNNFGNIITLITKDIQILETNMWILRDYVQVTIDVVTATYLLYKRIGNTAFIALGLVCFAIPLQVYLSAKLRKIRWKVGRNSDERVQKTQETLSAIKIVKMYTWEFFLRNRISESRRKEVNSLVKVFMINTIINTVGTIISKVSFIILIMVYITMGHAPSTETVFYIMQIFNQLGSNIGSVLPTNFSKTAQFFASITRLEEALQADEIDKIENEHVGQPRIVMNCVSFDLGERELLTQISLDINELGLTVLTGGVGAGKSSLLKIILGDYLSLKEGTVKVSGDISYSPQDPWIFPGTLRQNIIFGEEYDKSRYDQVLHVCALNYDISLLEQGDLTVLADRGQNLSKGQQARINLARAVYRNSNIYLLDDCLTALDSHVQEYIFNECLIQFLKDKMVILVTQNSVHIQKANHLIALNNGHIMSNSNVSRFKEKNTPVSHVFSEVAKKVSTTKFEAKANRKSSRMYKNKESQVEQQGRHSIYKETKKKGTVDLNIYRTYIHYGGGLTVFFLIILVYIGAQTCDSYSDKLVSQWVNQEQEVKNMEKKHETNSSAYEKEVRIRNFTLDMAGLMIIVSNLLYVIKYLALLWFCRTASINLHNKMTLSIIGSTMLFLDTHFVGNILNRVSYDLNNIDENIPFVFPAFASTLFDGSGSIILMTTVNWFFWIPILIFFVSVLLMRNLVMPAVRSLKRLEASTRSPMVGHINSSLEGLTTIRAFNAEYGLNNEFDRHQDLYSSALMTLRVCICGFHFYMELISVLFVFSVICRFLFFEYSVTAGDVGLALTQVTKLRKFVQNAINAWTDLESNMTSVERAIEYTNLEQESIHGADILNWPSRGSLRFEKVQLCYQGSKSATLKGISFEVNPREKIGIVGRTGAGKSSIITVLYRLYKFDGTIYIDGIDTKTLKLQFLRKNIAIVPQDPILFTGTIRENVDPENKFADDLIWNILGRLRLKNMFPSLEARIQDGGSSYSSGQKQLICLVRAALSKSKILILDEATANMDSETDKMFHDIIEEEFTDCTILMIAHRLNLILNCDKVLVLDQGNIAEFENPRTLLNTEHSLFRKMFEEYQNN